MARSKSAVDRVIGAIVPKAVGALDADELLESIDVNALLERIDLDAVLARIDMDELLESIDVDALVARINLAALLERVDIDSLVARVDVNAMLDEVDLDSLLRKIDINVMLEGVDIAALMARAGIDKIVSDASTGLATRVLDTARSQVLGIDVVILGMVDRVLRRRTSGRHYSSSGGLAVARSAGPLSRLFAFMIDSFTVSAAFSVAINLASSLIGLFSGRELDLVDNGGPGWIVAFGTWWFLYLWITVAISGRTLGKGLLGIRVVAVDGEHLGPGKAALRAIAFPFSFIFGIGFVPMVLGRARRAMHDYIAGSREIVDWGPREVVLPGALTRWTQ